jgi:hypothetical protein
MNDLPESGDKPNRSRSLSELTGQDESPEEERDETLVQLNVRVPKYLRTKLKHRTVGTDDTMEGVVEEALSNYLDI